MADTYTSSLRLRLIETGTRPNTWGSVANTDVFTLADAAIAGTTTKALTTNYTLTSNNGAADEARSAILKFTGTGSYQVTIPSASKTYRVWNGCTGTLTLTTGSGDTAVLAAGEINDVLCDGTNVKASGTGSASWKTYIDSVVLPSQTGHSGKVITTNGSAASWATIAAILGYTPVAKASNITTLYAGSFANGGTAISLPSGWTSTQTNTGRYTLTHNLGSTAYRITANPNGTSAILTTLVKGSNTVTFEVTNNAGSSFVDAAIDFVLVV